MDPLPLVWLTSIVGAGAFSSAGYVLGQRGARVAAKDLPIGERPTASPPLPVVPIALLEPSEATQDEETRVGVVSPQIARAAATSESHFIGREQLEAMKIELAAAQAEATEANDKAKTAEAAKAKLEASLAAANATAEKARAAESSAKAALEKALAAASAATEKATAAEAGNLELARQIEIVRNELRDEVIARATASARADELGDRLAKASEETASLRHKLSLSDKQAKQLRDNLSDRARALSTSETQRKREIEETEDMRHQLRDLHEKLERASLPPNHLGPNGSQRPPAARVSAPPANGTSAPPRASNDEAVLLQSEVARLAAENRDLRTQVLGSLPPKRPTSRASAPDLDLDIYRSLIEQLGRADGARCAVIADEVGSLLVGSGDLAEGLAAFGAYIRDASSRTERLLPLEGVEEINIRDRRGTLLSTRVIARSPTELSLVVIGNEGASLTDVRTLTEEALRLRST